ncbi:glycosyltransferase family 2 protein [Fructilactobacillus vespulae]|uniref:glycosyltransferase family 2 protein n=1 Tax=Fructilactobacillus vespulae TaxID=1249630 RepID=UPI0039B56660
MNNDKVATILVTFNRLELLKKSIKKLEQQTYQISKIFIINNCSTDDTAEYLNNFNNNNLFQIINLDNNIGGAGGFSYGLKESHNQGDYDFYWIMDDDTMPEPTALEELMQVDCKNGVLASNVLWGNTNSPAIMNVPEPDRYWTTGSLDGLNKIKSTSFVSMLVSNNALEECGLPIKEFFIWGDDVEFSRRIIRKFGGYFVPNSIVRHETKNNTTVDIIEENNPNRLGRYFYAVRNKMFMDKQDGIKSLLKNECSYFMLIFKIIFSKNEFKIEKIKNVVKGHLFGIVFNPKIRYIKNK